MPAEEVLLSSGPAAAPDDAAARLRWAKFSLKSLYSVSLGFCDCLRWRTSAFQKVCFARVWRVTTRGLTVFETSLTADNGGGGERAGRQQPEQQEEHKKRKKNDDDDEGSSQSVRVRW